MRSRSSVIASVLLVFIFTCTAIAQTFRGSIQGTVTDGSGAAVPGALVKVFSPGTGLSRMMKTNDQGVYVASELPLGTYNVTVEMQGYKTTTLTEIPVSVGSPTRADAKLAAGAVQETVEVTADVPLVETTSNTTGGTIGTNEAAQLPINGRDYTKLLELKVAKFEPNLLNQMIFQGTWQLQPVNGKEASSHFFRIEVPNPPSAAPTTGQVTAMNQALESLARQIVNQW